MAADAFVSSRPSTQEDAEIIRHALDRLLMAPLGGAHTSIQTTVDLYGHLNVEDARSDLRLLELTV